MFTHDHTANLADSKEENGKLLTLRKGRCTRCHHSFAEHEDTLLGTMCTGRDWHEQNNSPACQCDGFTEKKEAS